MIDVKTIAENVPECLRNLPQWVAWKLVVRKAGEKPTKVPVSAEYGWNASSTDPGTWAPYQRAVAAAEGSMAYEGVGFVFSASDPYCGIDLDGCIVDGELTPEAEEIVREFNTYAEVSPSGTGVKMFLKGKKPDGAGCAITGIAGTSRVEIYDTGRFFTVTGRLLPDSPREVADCQSQLDAFCNWLWPPKTTAKPPSAVPLHEFLTAPSASTTGEPGDMASRERRCMAYVEKCPDAISGQGGHTATFRAACECFRFGLDEAAAWRVMRKFNDTKTGGSPWSDKELNHKLNSARKKIEQSGEMGVHLVDLTPPASETSLSALTQANPVTPQPSPAPPLPTSKVRLVRADQIEMRPPHWLLRGMLERDTLALIFGDPGGGKSFLAIDWACRIATGTAWRGRDIKSGPVVYIAGEGQQGFGRRIRAWSKHHGVSLGGMPLYLASAVAIAEQTDLVDLIAAIDAGVVAVGGCPVLIVLDTLARCFGDGDENSTQDMSRFVAACDAVRQRYGCTILVVHHAGHGDKSRARGAIALKAALDAEYRIENSNGMRLTSTKMKDAETPAPLTLQLVTVDLPELLDDDGNPVTSAAIEVLDADTSALVANVAASGTRGKWQAMGLEVARRLVAESDDRLGSVKDWHQACDDAGMPRSTRYDVIARLHEQGHVVVDGEQIAVPDRPVSNPIQPL